MELKWAEISEGTLVDEMRRDSLTTSNANKSTEYTKRPIMVAVVRTFGVVGGWMVVCIGQGDGLVK